jgi:uncharacterized protein YecE (DUF72 family)
VFAGQIEGAEPGHVACPWTPHANFADDQGMIPVEVIWAALGSARIARVAADPARVPAAAHPGGWRGLTYVRWHGSPQMYASPYPAARIAEAARMLAARPPGTPGWMIFDNTMLGAAAANALTMLAL